MARRQAGVVKELYRYPVKSMLGERLGALVVGAHGAIGDRAWALRETATGFIVTAKKFARMFELSARYAGDPAADAETPVKIALPGGREVDPAAAETASELSGFLGREVTVERARPKQHTRAGIDPDTIFGDVRIEQVMPGLTRATMPPSFSLLNGGFFDSAEIHLLATGTLAHLAALIGPDVRLDARRFRPNIVVDTGDAAKGFVEDGWLGGAIEIGGVEIVSAHPALRCVMTTHRQSDLPRDLRVLRTIAEAHRATLGVFASIGAPGAVKVGDPVWIVD